MRSFRSRLFAFLCACALATVAARAATTTYYITFQTYGDYTRSGAFTLTFDPDVNTINDITSGFTINYLSFSAPPSGFNYSLPSQELKIGGLVTSASAIRAGTDDFVLAIYGFPTQPYFDLFDRTYVGSNQYETSYSGSGSVTVTKVALTPEPSSFALLTTALFGTGLIVRRRWTLA